jgi:hypothetical protein
MGPGGIGIDGNRILSGAGVPGLGTGDIGDYYIDFTSYNLYGPKIDNDTVGWTGSPPLNLKGGQGAQGEVGPIGPDGNTGADGADGNTLLYGDGPPTAGTGRPNDFYLDVINYEIYGPKSIGNTWPTAVSIKANIYAQGIQPSNPLQNTIWIDTSNL